MQNGTLRESSLERQRRSHPELKDTMRALISPSVSSLDENRQVASNTSPTRQYPNATRKLGNDRKVSGY